MGGANRGPGVAMPGVGMNDAPTPHGALGGYVPMVDGPEKVTGAAKYTADFASPSELCGRIFRSPEGHAEIVKIDVSEARHLPGVVAEYRL